MKITLKETLRRILGVVFTVALFTCIASAQFSIPWNTLDGGGLTFSSGGTFTLGGTIGQPDAGSVMTGGNFSLSGGFWVGAPATVVVSGKLILDELNPSPLGYKATFKFYKSGNNNCNNPDYVSTVSLTAGSTYTLTTPALGTNVRVVVKAGNATIFDNTARYHWLAKRISGVNMSGGTASLPTTTLLNGDCNDDNMIDAFDFTILMQAYDIAENTTYGQTDLNEDGNVDAFDFTIMMLSYDSAGDSCI